MAHNVPNIRMDITMINTDKEVSRRKGDYFQLHEENKNRWFVKEVTDETGSFWER